MIKTIFNKLNHILVCGLVVFASVFVASNADAANKDMLILGNPSGVVAAGDPQNPFEGELRVDLPEGIVTTTVDGSISSADFKDRMTNADKLYVDGNLLATVTHDGVCLSVDGNKAILWHRFTNSVEEFCSEGELGLILYDGDSNTAKAINATRAHNITELESRGGCSQSDADLLEGATEFQISGSVQIIDGV